MTVTVAVGVIVPLISAALAGFIAWIVANRQCQSTREQWILDTETPAQGVTQAKGWRSLTV